MELDWETRPVSVHSSQQPALEWRSRPSGSFYTSASGQRRRTSAAPPAPPPNEPIPGVPHGANSAYQEHPIRPPTANLMYGHYATDGATSELFGGGSTHPAAVAAFSASRHFPSPDINGPFSTGSSVGALRRPHQVSLRSPAQTQYSGSHRSSPTLNGATPVSRPSSRRALTRALALAREAVKLDSNNDDPHAAVLAYGQSVALLSEVMERVRRGEEGAESSRRRNGRRRSNVAQEEEIRRLKTIHDLYADRMNILSVTYSIPPTPASMYALSMTVSTDSTQPSSPGSPSPSESDPARAASPSLSDSSVDPYRQTVGDDATYEMRDGLGLIGSAAPSAGAGPFDAASATPNSSIHPYASASRFGDTPSEIYHQTLSSTTNSHTPRPPVIAPHPLRASSSLTLPATLNSPNKPSFDEAVLETASSNVVAVGRPRDGSIGHQRASMAGKLEALEEETERKPEPPSRVKQTKSEEGEGIYSSPVLDARRTRNPDEPIYLPSSPSAASTPSSSSYSLGTPRHASDGPSATTVGGFVAPRRRGGSALSVQSAGWTALSKQQLVNSSTVMGTIRQRRSKGSAPPASVDSSPTDRSAVSSFQRSTQSFFPPNSVSNTGMGRARASSQSSRWPSLINSRNETSVLHRPPMPASSDNSVGKSSLLTKMHPNAPLVIRTDSLPPSTSLMQGSSLYPLALPTTPASPLPAAPPTDPLHKPYYLMHLLRTSMTCKSGGYITRRLHVPLEVWSQGGAKLMNILEKIRVVEVLCSALEELENTSRECFGGVDGMSIGTSSFGRKEAEMWISKLEEFSSVCDGVVSNFGKKLGVGEGFVLKKMTGVTSWGGKLTRQLDKFTNGKNLDSPAAYVHGLAKLFSHAQLLDEHTKALLSQPVAPAYASLSSETRTALGTKFKRFSEFFATVVLTFVIRDLSQLLDKYCKKCEKWLAE